MAIVVLNAVRVVIVLVTQVVLELVQVILFVIVPVVIHRVGSNVLLGHAKWLASIRLHEADRWVIILKNVVFCVALISRLGIHGILMVVLIMVPYRHIWMVLVSMLGSPSMLTIHVVLIREVSLRGLARMTNSIMRIPMTMLILKTSEVSVLMWSMHLSHDFMLITKGLFLKLTIVICIMLVRVDRMPVQAISFLLIALRLPISRELIRLQVKENLCVCTAG